MNVSQNRRRRRGVRHPEEERRRVEMDVEGQLRDGERFTHCLYWTDDTAPFVRF